MDAKQYLFDGNRRLPRFLLIEDREAHSTRRVDVGMEQRRDEFACRHALA